MAIIVFTVLLLGEEINKTLEIKGFKVMKKNGYLYQNNRSFLVGVTGLEPAASCSQSRRATSCATPRRQNKGRLCIVMLTQNSARNRLFFLSEKISHTLLSFRVKNRYFIKIAERNGRMMPVALCRHCAL